MGGVYAEYLRVMSFVLPGVLKIPLRSSFAEGALLEPVNTVLNAVHRLNLLRGDTVLVAGQGPIGLMFTRLLALQGISVVARDRLKPRLRLALQFGARWSINANTPTFSERIQRLTHGRGLDAAIVAAPSDPVVLQAQVLVRGASQILLFAHTLRGLHTAVDLAPVCVDEKDLLGSYSSDFTVQKKVAQLVFSRRLDVRRIITHEFPLERTGAAIELASQPTPDLLKVLVVQNAFAHR